MINDKEVKKGIEDLKNAIKRTEEEIKKQEDVLKQMGEKEKEYQKMKWQMRGQNVPRTISEPMEKAHEMQLRNQESIKKYIKDSRKNLEANKALLKKVEDSEKETARKERFLAERSRQQAQDLLRPPIPVATTPPKKPSAPIIPEVVGAIAAQLPQNNRPRSDFEDAWSANRTPAEQKESFDIISNIKKYGISKYAEQYNTVAENIGLKSIEFIKDDCVISFKSPGEATVNQSDDASLQRVCAMYAAGLKIGKILPENIAVTGKTPEIQARMEKIMAEELNKLNINSVLINGKHLTTGLEEVASPKKEPVAAITPIAAPQAVRP